MSKTTKLTLPLFIALVAVSWSSVRADFFFMHWFQRRRPDICKDPSVERVAKEIDYLEAQIETYGTIVPKHPDVWGEARLTRHRHEVEKDMAGQIGEFEETLNASIRRSDQSFLSAAMTIGRATDPVGDAPSEVTSINNFLLPRESQTTNTSTRAAGVAFANSEGDALKLSLEPTVVLEQRFRYLNLLNELRRINEGDDTSDAPGYSLNIVRIPISVLSGKKTRKGFGAEITITARPQLTSELLPKTFRNLVINDVVDMLALPGRKVLDHPEVVETLRVAQRDHFALLQLAAVRDAIKQRRQEQDSIEKSLKLSNLMPTRRAMLDQQLKDVKARASKDPMLEKRVSNDLSRLQQTWSATNTDTDVIRKTIDRVAGETLASNGVLAFAGTLVSGRSTQPLAAFPPAHMVDIFGPGQVFAPIVIDGTGVLAEHPVNQHRGHVSDVEAFLRGELHAAHQFLSRPEAAYLWHNYCTQELVDAIRQRRRYLRDDLYEYLKLRKDIQRLDELNRPIFKLRSKFFSDLSKQFPRAAYSTTTSLAWAIIVDAALLNDQLIQDMRKVAVEKNCPELQGVPDWLDFYAPNPSPTARELFKAYVRCRWPVKVFAMDPVNDEQNVADAFSMRREMQLAAAAALANGNVSSNAAFRFLRRTELDIETIALNRKTVGFAHGANTFGWRFYPRVQTPPTVGTLEAFQQTLTGPPNEDYLLNRRQLEPGIREVTAVVLMPSFVPHLIFDTRANWFKLTNPKHKELALRDTMKISRTWQSLRTAMPTICNGKYYRAEDISWLCKAVDQIEHRLPLQSMLVQIPFENTLGGFEMFNSGVTDLAPSLSGFYGEPGITVRDPNVACECPSDGDTCPAKGGLPYAGVAKYAGDQCEATCLGTTLFLVGKNFSVHDTKVIAGGRCAPFQLMSRNIMQVTIPPNVTRLLDERNKEVVDVHVATPYGVSNHLLIPAVEETAPAVAEERGFFFKQTKLHATVCIVPERTKDGKVVPPHFDIDISGAIPNLVIENKTGFPTPEGAEFQVIAAVEVEGGSKPAVQFIPIDITRAKTNQLTVSKTQYQDQLKDILENAEKLLTPVADKPLRINIAGFLRFGENPSDKEKFGTHPPLRIGNQIVIELGPPMLCAKADAGKEEANAEEVPAPPVPEPAPEILPPGNGRAWPKQPTRVVPRPVHPVQAWLPRRSVPQPYRQLGFVHRNLPQRAGAVPQNWVLRRLPPVGPVAHAGQTSTR